MTAPRTIPSHAFEGFVKGNRELPYVSADNPFGIPCRVSPVRLKSRFAASTNNMITHLVARAASVTFAGEVVYATRWQCGNGSVDAVLLPDGDATDTFCGRCLPKLHGDGPGVYRIFRESGRLLYIGSSVDPDKRLEAHRARSRWWHLMADVEITRYPTLLEARRAEVAAIATEHPEINTHGRRKTAP